MNCFWLYHWLCLISYTHWQNHCRSQPISTKSAWSLTGDRSMNWWRWTPMATQLLLNTPFLCSFREMRHLWVKVQTSGFDSNNISRSPTIILEIRPSNDLRFLRSITGCLGSITIPPDSEMCLKQSDLICCCRNEKINIFGARCSIPVLHAFFFLSATRNWTSSYLSPPVPCTLRQISIKM